MFKALLPKEERYFEDFKEMIAHAEQMGEIARAFFADDKYDQTVILKMKTLEKRCDEIESRIAKRLNHTFITPFDREDIFSLAKRIDSISDLLFSTVSLVDSYCLTEKVNGAKELSEIILQQIRELKRIVGNLNSSQHDSDECKAVKDLESEADTIFRASIKKLFTKEKDAITLIKKKEILEGLENTADKCQSTANVILSILLKNS